MAACTHIQTRSQSEASMLYISKGRDVAVHAYVLLGVWEMEGDKGDFSTT